MNFLPGHRSHDDKWLMTQWRRVAKAARMKMSVLATVGDEPVYQLFSNSVTRGDPVVYLSAGVHGDEPGAVCGLLAWAIANQERLKEEPFVILPCLNPQGLRQNVRMDHKGQDLNRRFHIKRDPLVRAWHGLVSRFSISVGLCLHEDYDAQGFYVYELDHHRRSVGSAILKGCESAALGRDPRRTIDGQRANHGVIRRKKIPESLPGLPEAIVLYQAGCPLTLTFETPSEFDLDVRAQAHARFIDSTLRVVNHQA